VFGRTAHHPTPPHPAPPSARIADVQGLLTCRRLGVNQFRESTLPPFIFLAATIRMTTALLFPRATSHICPDYVEILSDFIPVKGSDVLYRLRPTNLNNRHESCIMITLRNIRIGRINPVSLRSFFTSECALKRVRDRERPHALLAVSLLP
jgi:hypothetical protein